MDLEALVKSRIMKSITRTRRTKRFCPISKEHAFIRRARRMKRSEMQSSKVQSYREKEGEDLDLTAQREVGVPGSDLADELPEELGRGGLEEMERCARGGR